jgi:aminoglycoside phosphotransferase family enzyme/predicted kinase
MRRVFDAQLRETHSALVLLAGSHAYKAKKPVYLGFLDFRAVADRVVACRREIEMNRRLAPDVYLGLGTFTAPDAADPEPIVVMRRMPDETRLATLVSTGADVSKPLQQLARLLAGFHERAARSVEISFEGGATRLRTRWLANLTESEPFCPQLIDSQQHMAIRRLALRYVDGRRPLFASRADAGLVVDGHGDLVAEDIFCLPDGPRVLDCLDFDDRLRWVDVLDDVAFLVMDLEYLGRPDLGATLVDWYHRYTATALLPSLLDHFVAYRAFVRAKVAAIRAAQGGAATAVDVRRHVDLTLQHLRAGEVKLVLVGGPPASGKSTVSEALSASLDYAWISTDAVRRELAQGSQRYTVAAKDATYTELLRRTKQCLEHGQSVIADATWDTTLRRELAAAVATETHSVLVPIECTVPGRVAAAWAERRQHAGTDPSEAGASVATALAARRDPWPGAVRVDTTTGTALAAALDVVRAASAERPAQDGDGL